MRTLAPLALGAALLACAAPPTDDAPATAESTGRAFALDGGQVLAVGRQLVVAEPGEDRLLIYGWASAALDLEGTVELAPGDAPGRMVSDGEGRLFVALPGAGAVATVDLEAARVIERTTLCRDPRGLDWHPGRGALFVACAEGRLIVMESASPGATEVSLPDDLRDVAVDANGSLVYVSRFRQAEVLTLDAETLERVGAWRPPFYREPTTRRVFEPRLAWRLRARPEGGFGLLHQRHLRNPVPESAAQASSEGEPGTVRGGYGRPPSGGAGSGNLDPCVTGVVQSALTEEGPGAGAPTGEAVRPLVSSAFAVDFAYHRPAEPLGAPADDRASVYVAADGGVHRYLRAALWVRPSAPGGRDCVRPNRVFESGAGAVPGGVDSWRGGAAFVDLAAGELRLGGHADALPGGPVGAAFARFHQVMPAGVACASCHPGGREDGHTWAFAGKGFRRTQSLIDALDQAPFHRDGEHPSFADVWHDAFVLRMGGEPDASEGDIDGVRGYLASLTRPTWSDATEEVVALGQQVYAERGCGDCHGAGGRGGDRVVDLGGGEGFLPPSLAGVALRAPYFHDGCASDLDAALDGSCVPGPEHTLAPPDREALAAYLRAR